MTNNFIPYGRQRIDEDDIAFVSEVLRSDFLTTGPIVDEFEAAFAEAVGSKYAVACSSGTAALHLAALALEQRGVLEDGRVVLLEGERARDGAELREEPVAHAHLVGEEVARPRRRLERDRDQVLLDLGDAGALEESGAPRGAGIPQRTRARTHP